MSIFMNVPALHKNGPSSNGERAVCGTVSYQRPGVRCAPAIAKLQVSLDAHDSDDARVDYLRRFLG